MTKNIVRQWHLIVRRKVGARETIKYSFSNVPAETTSERLTFMQGQRYLVERSGRQRLDRHESLPDPWLADHYLLSRDGTGYYASTKVASPFCLGQKKKNGEVLSQLKMYAAPFDHPDSKLVIPACPEMITKQDGTTKEDCERNASKRFLAKFRREHPHLKVIVVEDGLSSNGPHIRELQRLNLRYILGAKPDDHVFLFQQLRLAAEKGWATDIEFLDREDRIKAHFFRFANQIPLNKANPDLLVNVLEYWQIEKGEKITKFSWVTDIPITEENVFKLMRAGRARWKIENETFNTLNIQGYNLGHNYGLGKKNLSAVFAILMMLAFLIDQVQQLSCWLFQEALKKAGIQAASVGENPGLILRLSRRFL